jgi:hypothetical protein
MSGKAGRMKIYNKRKRPERGKRRGWKEKRAKEEKGGEGRSEEMEGAGEGSRRLPGLMRGRKKG